MLYNRNHIKLIYDITLEVSVEEDYKQSNKAGRAENKVEDSSCNGNLNWRDPKVVIVYSCIVKTAHIVGHQVN